MKKLAPLFREISMKIRPLLVENDRLPYFGQNKWEQDPGIILGTLLNNHTPPLCSKQYKDFFRAETPIFWNSGRGEISKKLKTPGIGESPKNWNLWGWENTQFFSHAEDCF